MSRPPGAGRPIRFRTASDKKKALAQYDELRRSGRVARAVVIAELHDESYQVLGQGMSPDQIAQCLVVAAEALAHVDQTRQTPHPEPHQEPEKRGERTGIKRASKEITFDAEGVMVPPPGENFVSCGECNHPRWYVLHTNADDVPARFACAHCGNEVKLLRVRHEAGRA